MRMSIRNRNLESRYPLVMATCDIITYFDKLTGLDSYVIELNNITDLLTFEAAIRASEESYSGLLIEGTTITIQNGDVII